ncbi:MAG: 3-oxoadipate enol-lactonase [Deltaproteobacteria bacterium]|nr:3-oxoadipate enol-lactonase [Deltaproteobacteria bacterium]
MKIEANGISIHYMLDGAESAPVVTLSHSLATDLTMWEPQMDALLTSYRVLRYDTRGHGKTSVPRGPYSFDMLAGDVAALLKSLGIEKTLFMGISMGGMIGQALALKSQDLLSGLILCDTMSRIPDEAKSIWDERIDSVQKDGMESQVESTIQRWLRPPYREKNPEVVGKVEAMIRTTKPEGYIGCAQAIRELNLTEQISGITIPTLIIVGEDDPATPVFASQEIKDKIKNSELVILGSAAHLSNIEQSEAFNRAVLNFLRKGKP